jgi:hypothetical protein
MVISLSVACSDEIVVEQPRAHERARDRRTARTGCAAVRLDVATLYLRIPSDWMTAR